jgi:hypothetical protein
VHKRVFIGLATIGTLTLSGIGIGIGIGIGATAAATIPPVSAQARSSVVPVTVLDGQGTPEGARPTVEVSVGESRPVPVLLDTGSSGLHLFDTAVDTGAGSGVTLTSEPASITYSGGDKFSGVVADATVTIGSSATKAPVAFAYVERATCVASKPTCSASGGITGYEESGMYGILGIGTQQSDGGIVSPILGMPKPLRTKWSLHLSGNTGVLTLGARNPSSHSSTSIPMRQDGSSGGAALWDDSRLRLCLDVGIADECVPGLFDSGTYSMQISGPALDQAPTTPGTDEVVGGTPVAVRVSGAAAPFWTFSAGTIKSEDLVTVKTSQGPFLNTGVQAFYDFTITYDDVTGQIRLSL